MNDEKTRLVEEGNTIYEIDLECMQRKQERNRKWESRKKRIQPPKKCLTNPKIPLILCDKLKL